MRNLYPKPRHLSPTKLTTNWQADNSKAESKESASHEADAKGSGAKAAAPAMVYESKSQEVEPAPERGKSRGGTRGGKPQNQSADIGLSSPTINLDAEMDRCDGSFGTTQALLGELITKPKLTDKLLSKPPFKFLYDIIMEVSEVTDFASGLFSEEERNAAASEKNQKLLFLEKIIRVVGVQLNTLVEAKPLKIASGLDPEATNRFLQYLAVAAKHAPDSRNAVRTVLEQLGLPPNASAASPAKTEVARPAPADEGAESKSVSRPALAAAAAAAPAAPFASSKAAEPERREVGSDDKGGDDEAEAKRSTRPTTARRRPPKVKDGAKEVDKRDTVAAVKAEGIMTDGAGDDDDDDIPDETRLADDVADTKGGAGIKDAQSKLVKDILGRQAEQEAVRTGGVQPVEAGGEDAKGTDETGKGGIRLGRLRKTGSEKKGSISTTAVLAEGDIERLRGAIQVLVQHTGPLGSCLDFLQEDVGLMTAELRRWEEEARRYEVRVDNERQRSQEILHPLQAELMDVDDQVKLIFGLQLFFRRPQKICCPLTPNFS